MMMIIIYSLNQGLKYFIGSFYNDYDYFCEKYSKTEFILENL